MNHTTYVKVGAVIIVITVAFVGFVLWLRGHDADVKASVTGQVASADVKAQQENINNLMVSITQLNNKIDDDRKANDARFDSMRTVMQQAVNMAQTMGMKQQPVVIQPGTNPALPQGGLYLNPQQVQEAHEYEKKCEDCKIENDGLHRNVDKLTGVIAGKDKQLGDKDLEIKDLNRQLRHGFRYRLEDCATRAAVGATSGAIGAALATPNPLQTSKPVGKGAAIGGAIGVFSCLIKR